MSNSLWRVVGYSKEGVVYSNSGQGLAMALDIAKRQKGMGHFPIAVMPESESATVSGTPYEKKRAFVDNMGKALLNPEWLFPDPLEAFEACEEWKRLNGYAHASQVVFATPGPRKPKPQICPEVWREKPEVDKTDYMAAVRSMCGESGKGE